MFSNHESNTWPPDPFLRSVSRSIRILYTAIAMGKCPWQTVSCSLCTSQHMDAVLYLPTPYNQRGKIHGLQGMARNKSEEAAHCLKHFSKGLQPPEMR